MAKVICIGSSSKDIFFPTDAGKIFETPNEVDSPRKIAFELGAKFHINDRFESLGGCGANQAIGLVRLGIHSVCQTAIGSDAIGKWIKERFIKEGVGADLLEMIHGSLSGLSAIIVDKNTGERIIFSNQEANEKLIIDPTKLAGADFVSITDLSGNWKSVADTTLDFCEKNSIKAAFNPRGRNIKEDAQKVFKLAGKCEIFFVNKDEAIEILASDSNNEEYLLAELKKSGAKIVVITDGERGVWVSDGKKTIHAEAVRVEKLVDTTGAGDAFASGFIAAHIKNMSLEECVSWGVKNGASVVQYYGGVEGLLKENEIENSFLK